MFYNCQEVLDFEESQYDKLFSSNVWTFNSTKENYPESAIVNKSLFKTDKQLFHIYKNDSRDPINVSEYQLFKILKANNPNTLFHSIANYLPLTKFVHFQDLYKHLNKLEVLGYIRVDRNYDVDDIFRSYNSKKQFMVKIYAVDNSGKELTITYSEKKRREINNKIKKKNSKAKLYKKKEIK